MKIANKISLSFFIVAVIITMIIASVSYIVEKKSLEQGILAHLITTTESRAAHVKTFLDMCKRKIAQLSESIIMKNFLKTTKDNPNYSDSFNKVIERLERTKESGKDIDEVFLLNKEGVIVASSNKDRIGLDRVKDQYFTEGKKGLFIKDVYYSGISKSAMLAISAPIIDKTTGEVSGVIVKRINLTELNKILADRSGLGQTGEAYLTNKDFHIITLSHFIKSDSLKLEIDTEHVKKIRKWQESTPKIHNPVPFLYKDYRGVSVLGAHAHIEELEWSLFAEIDEEEVFTPLQTLKALIIGMLLIIPVISWLIGTFVGRAIFSPLRKLHQGSEIIGSGNLDYKVGTKARDEIGQLSRAFDNMVGDLKKVVVSKDYLDSIIGSMSDILIVTTPEGVIKTVNSAACELLGYKPKELIGKDVSLLFLDKESPFEGEKFEKLIKSGHLVNYKVNYKAKDGKKISVLFGSAVVRKVDCPNKKAIEDCPVFKEKGKHCEKLLGIVCVAKDITVSNRVEKALEAAYQALKLTQSQLIQAEKMEAIGRMASGMAHEVRNPLGIILQGIYFLEKRLTPNQNESREVIQMLRSSIKRANDIICAMVDYSKETKLALKPKNINSILKESLGLIKHRAKLESIKIIKKLGEKLPKVLVDKGRIEQVFINIFLNASQAMPGGGKLFIRSYLKQLTKSDKQTGTKYFKLREEAVIVEIEDTGVGIPKENLNKLFEPFFTTKGPKDSSGLGLPVTKSIIDVHQGFIEVESEVNKGTKVIVTLKVAKEGDKNG